jgi:hypothetical protein
VQYPLGVAGPAAPQAGSDRNEVTLSWTMSSESDVAKWEIERSRQLTGFGKTGEVLSRGPATAGTSYRYTETVAEPGIYWYRLAAVSDRGTRTYYGPVLVTVGLPSQFLLGQSRPNPSRGPTTISYQLSQAGRTTLRVYNALGQAVRTLVDAEQQPNYFRIAWDGRDDAGHQAASGIYYYRLTSGLFKSTKKMVVLR